MQSQSVQALYPRYSHRLPYHHTHHRYRYMYCQLPVPIVDICLMYIYQLSTTTKREVKQDEYTKTMNTTQFSKENQNE